MEFGLPKSWKSAIITMIPKLDMSTTNYTDYRPISLLSCVGKLIERIVRNRVYAFLESYNLIIKEQSGFRSKRGTWDNLLFITQKIEESLSRGKNVCGINFDISKAFDKVWHAGVIYKLINLNVPKYLIRFIKDFLTDRTFKVKVNNSISEPFPVTCSVPQGSVLGPLLFVVYINDIPITNKLNSSYSALFADDLGVIFIFKKQGKIRRLMKDYLENLVSWLYKWRLKMNANKCCYTIFSRKGRKDIEFALFLKGERVPYNPNPVFLGITFDEHLNFGDHFSKLRGRALKRLNIIKIFSHRSWHISKKTLINIYKALIGSIFDYSFFTIASVANSNLNLIQTVQNRAIRCIYKLKWDSPTGDLFRISGVLPIKDRFFQLGARYLVKIICFKNPFVCCLVSEYKRSLKAITAKNKTCTVLCKLLNFLTFCFASNVSLRLFFLSLII